MSTKVGGGGGQLGEAMCNANEVMVGVYGRHGSWVDRLGVRCVAVDVNGQWLGAVRNGPARGGRGGSQDLNGVNCPVNTAVVGITGAAGNYIHRLGMICKSLGSNARVGGSNVQRPVVGPTGGRNFAATHCDTAGAPASGLKMWTGSWVDAVQLSCNYRVPPAPASLSSPARGSTVTSFRPLFSWAGVPLADRYEVTIPAMSQRPATTNSWRPPSDVTWTSGGGLMTWSVRACNGNGCGPLNSSNFLFGAPGANYVHRQTNSPAKVNNQIHFTVTLQNTAALDTPVLWRLSPDTCFEQSSAGTPFQPGAKNSTMIQNGQNSRQLTVRIKNQQSCVTSGRLETWVRLLDSTSAPYYRTSDFSITW